jgi:hypothetical protein
MASRLERKQQARAARLAAERAAAASARRTRRARMLAGAVLAAAIVVAAIIAISVSGGGGGPHGLANGGARRGVEASVHTLLAGIPEHGQTLGDPHARATLTFFGDLQCPVCAALATGQSVGGATGGLPQFIARQVRSGRARIVYRSMCTATCNDAYAAGMQNRFWYFEELFYRQQGAEGTPYVTSAFLDRLAREVPGLRFKRWLRDRRDPRLLGQVRADGRAAVQRLPLVDGGRGTPGLIMSGPDGTRFVAEGLVDYGRLRAALRAVS